MQWPSKHTIVLIIFAAAWLYTEIKEEGERNTRYQEFVDFHKNEAVRQCHVDARLDALEEAK